MSESKDDFATSKWRPFMGWTYMFICLFDFCIGPVMNIVFSFLTKTPLQVWKSLTLDNGGLFHLAMGAVLGVAAYGRTQEKVKKMEEDNNPAPFSPPFGMPSSAPMSAPMAAPVAAAPQPMVAPAPAPVPVMEPAPVVAAASVEPALVAKEDISVPRKGRFK